MSTALKADAASSDLAAHPADRFMIKLLRVEQAQNLETKSADRAFRIALVISGVRCFITYLLVPILASIATVAGWVATPISIALCVFAVVNGIISLRRFWRSRHKYRWVYTGFIGVIFIVLGAALVLDINRLVAGL